jgi:putative NADPH-quinone reductase
VRVLVVHCHPDPESLTAAALGRVLAGLRTGGHTVRVRDLYAEGFRPELDRDELARHLDDPATKPEIAGHADDLRWCQALVLVYPTWWSGHPAVLKGWIDRVWVSGVAWELPPGSRRIRARLRNVRRIVAVTTHGSSKRVNLLEGEVGKRALTRTLRVLCSRRCRTSWIALYGVDTSTRERREQFLVRVEQRLARL